MEYSNLILNAKDIDAKKGIVSFYFADFNSVDSQHRRMDKSSFNRTINNNKQRFAHLLNHDTNLMIGKPLEVGVDSKGAFMVSQLSKNTAGRDALIMYEEGIITEHSFGFRIVDSVQDGKVEIVNELQMYEASSVTWGSNPNTPTISINSHQGDLVKEIQAMAAVNSELLDLLRNQDKKEIITILNDISSRLPDSKEHQASKTKSDIEDVMKFITEKY
jgi:HK97 family phage prohead protease